MKQQVRMPDVNYRIEELTAAATLGNGTTQAALAAPAQAILAASAPIVETASAAGAMTVPLHGTAPHLGADAHPALGAGGIAQRAARHAGRRRNSACRSAACREDQMEQRQLVVLDTQGMGPVRRALTLLAFKPVSALLGIAPLNARYSAVAALGAPDPIAFMDGVLRVFGVNYDIAGEGLERIPAEGPAVVVANHPYGGIEGIIMASLLGRVRRDVKIMATRMLKCIPEISDMIIHVDNFGGDDAQKKNIRPLKEALRHLKNGGILAVFPAGEVSSLNLATRTVLDPAWSPTIGRIVRRTKAPVLPVFFQGRNGPLFQMLGLMHPRLRTALLPRELLNKQGRTIRLTVGGCIPPRSLERLESDEACIEYLRLRTYMLRDRSTTRARFTLAASRKEALPAPCAEEQPLAAGPGAAVIAAEIAALDEDCRLLRSGDYDVLMAPSAAIPQTLREIGRLREMTFRSVGEGTGKELDLDRFDQYYRHLFVWDRAERRIVGAYRVGFADEIIAEHGVKGLYTSTLFKFKPGLFGQMGKALEMGRSFVRPEYQKNYAPLLLLWKGIARVVLRNPQYSVLFGPVSISNDYSATSKELIVRHLRAHNRIESLSRLVKPKTPPKLKTLKRHEVRQFQSTFDTIDDVTAVIGDIETEIKGIPVLLRQYLKLGGKVLGFNVDPDFNDCLDGLLVVDLLQTDPKVLRHYMGAEGADNFLEYHEDAAARTLLAGDGETQTATALR
jgi:putative hemolysin